MPGTQKTKIISRKAENMYFNTVVLNNVSNWEAGRDTPKEDP